MTANSDATKLLMEEVRMGLLDGYLKSLKPLSIEEPIDVWVHRPLAYLMALGLYPTPVSPNVVTVFSILCGCTACYAMVVPFAHHMVVAGLLIFLSAVADCADGQLARMRKTSSAFGRMLDGSADLIVSIAIVAGGFYSVVFRKHAGSPLEMALWAGLIVLTAVTGSWHTSGYDFYKNLFLRLTNPGHNEGEDLATATRRRQEQQGKESFFMRCVWGIYLYYVDSQHKFERWFDPYAPLRVSSLPAYDEGRAALYRQHAGGAMRLWRSLFGFGSMVFGFALFTALDALEVYVVLRGIGQNLLYIGYLRPLQQRSSKAAFSALGLETNTLTA